MVRWHTFHAYPIFIITDSDTCAHLFFDAKGIANTAIGGQRIEEYANNATITKCSYRTGANGTTGVDAEPARVGDSVRRSKQTNPLSNQESARGH